MKTKISADFQIYINAPLNISFDTKEFNNKKGYLILSTMVGLDFRKSNGLCFEITCVMQYSKH